MFGFSIGEVLLLAAIALIVIGPRQLPDFARQLGRIINELKRAAGDFTDEMKSQVRIDLNDIDSNRPNDKIPMDQDYQEHISVPPVPPVDATPADLVNARVDHPENTPPGAIPDVSPSSETLPENSGSDKKGESHS